MMASFDLEHRVKMLLVLLLLSDNPGLVRTLKLTELRIDRHTVRGNSTTMECNYDMEDDVLYAIKWYKDGNEFYRYIPKDSPPIQIFPVEGVRVNIAASGKNKVHLSNLELSSSGRYRCEVSGEAPSFTTVTEHSDMLTVALPEDGPRITGGKPRYQIGELVNVNCTSGRSKPATNLQWFINGDQVNSSYLRGPYRKYVGREGLEVTTLGLQFKVEAEHFKGGDMKLKCLATIATVYWKSNEESVEGEKQQKPPVMEIKRTELEDNNSRADRVQGNNNGRVSLHDRNSCRSLLLNLFCLYQIHYMMLGRN